MSDRFQHHETIMAEGADNTSEAGHFDILEDEISVYIFDRGAGMLASRHADAHAASRQARKMAEAWTKARAVPPQGESPAQGAHTPGPWIARLIQGFDDRSFVGVGDDVQPHPNGGLWIAEFRGLAHAENAKLGAAAPEMAAALRAMWAWASRMAERHGMNGDDSMTRIDHQMWQDAAGQANAAFTKAGLKC